MTADALSEALVRRLPGYYRHLREMEAAGIKRVSSMKLGRRMHQTASLIRQDINTFGGIGRQGLGYDVRELKEKIGDLLDLNRGHEMIILGAGNIGTAVAGYASFQQNGFTTVAMFDVNPAKIGTKAGGIPVLSMDALEDYVMAHPVDIAVLAVPKEQAVTVMERVQKLGIRAVWNFAPVDLQYDQTAMTVVNVHLSDTLQVLSYQLAHMR
ncbi:MAG: redox-sensing transcriptional repressor Rex [Clostridia bacterium]|nr:redox-sensing transcriptional repressor Rex [Clostridia bacterium]